MNVKVVVLGAGYAGTGAVKRLEKNIGGLNDVDLTWVSENDYHLVLHESHRVIRDPSVKEKITFPVNDIKSPETNFVQGKVIGIDTQNRSVILKDTRSIDYDYLLVAIGSGTAFYGIPGVEENSHTLNSLEDAVEIHESIKQASQDASREDPAQIVIGGAGLSGIQISGEIAEYRDHHGVPMDIHLVEALDEILPGMDSSLQEAVRKRIEKRDIEIMTNEPITEADASTVHFEGAHSIEYDVFVWTGGVTGRDALEAVSLDKEHNRLNTSSDFRTSDERVFAIGDTAVVDQGEDERPPPPTAQAAWQAAKVAGDNIINAIEGKPLKEWRYNDRGTLISVGETALAHDIDVVPVKTFDSYPAKFLKKFVAARWIADITSWRRALGSWGVL